MRRLSRLLLELLGLVVDDGSLAVATVVWIGATWLLVNRAALPPIWCGAVLFAGIAAVLIENVWRRARRSP